MKCFDFNNNQGEYTNLSILENNNFSSQKFRKKSRGSFFFFYKNTKNICIEDMKWMNLT